MLSLEDIFTQRRYDRSDVGFSDSNGYVTVCMRNTIPLSSLDFVVGSDGMESEFYTELEPYIHDEGLATEYQTVKFSITLYIGNIKGNVLVRKYPDETRRVPDALDSLEEWVKAQIPDIVLNYHNTH